MAATDRDEALRELGHIAMEKREDAGLSLEDIFERTRVRVEFLRGIENGVYQGFPDLVYIKGFVRTYLSVIGAEELKDEFMTWLNKESSPSDRRLPPANVLGDTTYPTKGFKLASHFWLFVVLILVMAGSGWYVWYSWSNSDVVFPRIDLTQQTAAVLSEEEESADVLQTLSPDNFLSVLPQDAPVIEPEPVAPYLHLRAERTDVWVEVNINDKVVFSRTMKPGTEVSWDLPARARVRYGRGNVATVILNGKELQNASAAGTYVYEPDGTFTRVR
jgi:hypothetical protein